MIVMKYADGGTLKSYLLENFPKLTSDDKLNLARQLAKGLRSIHDEDIIHRDLVWYRNNEQFLINIFCKYLYI